MGIAFSQLFPPTPGFTPGDLPDLTGKVFIVTGGASGIGAELVEILFRAGAKVYLAGRSETNARIVIEAISQRNSQRAESAGLEFLNLDLADLSTIRPAVLHFQEQENTLNVLFNNAAISLPPAGSTSAQGHELTMATNALGPHLLTQLLLPTLARTPDSRVVWTTSQNAELGLPKGGFTMDRIRKPDKNQQVYNYNASKLGNFFLSSELARGNNGRGGGVVSVTQNPGNVRTKLLRHVSGWQRVVVAPLLHSAYLGACTGVYAGLSPEMSSGDYVIPWGRKHPGLRRDFLDAIKRPEEGGTGLSLEFKRWCDECVKEYV